MDIKEFETAARPLIKWLNENCNPHSKVIVTTTDAELVSGERCFETLEYLVD